MCDSLFDKTVIKWNRLFTVFIPIFAILVVLPSQVFADSKTRESHPIQLQAASIIGYGASVGYHIFPSFYAGLESTSLSDSGTVMDIELDYSFKTNQIIARYFIWDQYGFCGQIGFISRDWTVTGTDQAYIGNDTVKRDYTLKIEWPNSAVSYGVGWFLVGKQGLSGGFGIGFISSGSPEVTITAPGASEADIALEENTTSETFKGYNVFPYSHLSVGWNF